MNNALYNQIRIFQSIAREGNISAAARKLEITPPSVSNALKLLEEYIGHPLFVRTTRRIELTETGQLLLEQTAAAVESLENSLESIRDQHQEPSGMVRITLSRFAYLSCDGRILSAISGYTVRNFGLRRYREYHQRAF